MCIPPCLLSGVCEPLQPPWAPQCLAPRPPSGGGKARKVEVDAHSECAAREAAGSPVQLPSLAVSGYSAATASPPALPTEKNENCGLQEIGLHLPCQSGPGGPCGHPCSAGAAATAAPAHLCCRGSCARAPCPTCPPTSAHSQPARPSLGPLLPALAGVSKAGARLISFDFLAPSISQSAQCRQVIAHEQHGLHLEPLLRC